MTFEFRAHPPSAYSRFIILLVLLIGVNIFFISLFFPQLKSINDTAIHTMVLVVPWLLLLLMPCVILGIVIYYSFVKTFQFTVEENFLEIGQLRRNGSIRWQKKIEWKDLIGARIVDFEDNHYCNLEFTDRKNNLVIHRDSGEFDAFNEALKKFSPAADNTPMDFVE